MQSLFFSPKAPTAGGLIWGVGPVLLLPTATDDLLGGEKWGLGPTGVVLTQRGPWTYGALANHIWSVAGNSDRADISATFLQPFLTYTTKTATTFGLNTESTYDWKSNRWTVPINVSVGQVLKLGDQLVQVGVGARYWAQSPASGPEGIPPLSDVPVPEIAGHAGGSQGSAAQCVGARRLNLPRGARHATPSTNAIAALAG